MPGVKWLDLGGLIDLNIMLCFLESQKKTRLYCTLDNNSIRLGILTNEVFNYDMCASSPAALLMIALKKKNRPYNALSASSVSLLGLIPFPQPVQSTTAYTCSLQFINNWCHFLIRNHSVDPDIKS